MAKVRDRLGRRGLLRNWRGHLAPALAVGITAAFFASFVADAANDAYTIPDALYGLMALAAGWAFSEGRLRRRD